MRCDRCGKESLGSIGSMFNTEQICFECKDSEQAHPMYEQARERELEAVKRGDYKFPGIGLPADLRGGGHAAYGGGGAPPGAGA